MLDAPTLNSLHYAISFLADFFPFERWALCCLSGIGDTTGPVAALLGLETSQLTAAYQVTLGRASPNPGRSDQETLPRGRNV